MLTQLSQQVKPTLHKAQGGTEILYDNLAKRVDLTGVNLIKSVCAFELLDPNKPNILWQHLNTNEQNVQLLGYPDYVKRLDAIVFVSHWQHEKFRRAFPLDNTPCYVIQNCIEPIEKHEKPDTLRLIYTSTPWRGLDLLAEVFERLGRVDVELVVYSGTSIYGPQFHEQTKHQFQSIYDRLKSVGARHIEYAPNSEIREALKKAHILAYPNNWEETSCLAAIEAMSAGCQVVTSNFGALPETCGTWAEFTPLGEDFIQRYTQSLSDAISRFWTQENQRKLADQVEYYNRYWSWDNRVNQWERLIGTYTKFLQQAKSA